MEDWRKNTIYSDGVTAESPRIKWFWQVVGLMSAEERSKLLFFCTGCSAAPAGGFQNLQGYNGEQHQFHIQLLDSRGPNVLPTAATCFNTLRLPKYTSESQTQQQIIRAIRDYNGFDEGAVAE